MNGFPRVLEVPHSRIPMAIPAGMSRVEFFNSAANLKNLTEENGLLRSPEDFLLYRKLIGHSLEFDASIILDTSQRILNPMGRPVRRDELTRRQRWVWSRMTQTIFQYMLETYPDPGQALVMCGEASLDPTWPLNKPGVPSIRMIHNHFIVFPQDDLRSAPPAAVEDVNLTDGGHHGLFLNQLSAVYRRFLETLQLEILKPIATQESQVRATGYPQGLPSWHAQGDMKNLDNPRFWDEYDLILKGFLDFYRAFFAQVSSRGAPVPAESYFPEQVENILYFNNDFSQVAKQVRDRIKLDPSFANELRWRPAYKQLLYRDDMGRLIVTISQNSVGNAITELLGIVVQRQENEAAYRAAEPRLIEKLLTVRERLRLADLGTPIHTSAWPDGQFVPWEEQQPVRSRRRSDAVESGLEDV
ncbi:MAG: hypothetical protein H7829_04445 [Magnetococcus sp. THC-1_WYH]